MKTARRFINLAISVLATGAAVNHRIRRLYPTRVISLICFSAFAAFAQNNLAFVYQIGGPVPSPQLESLTSTGSSPANLTLQISGQSWLLASLSSNSTPATLTVSVSPVGLPVGF